MVKDKRTIQEVENERSMLNRKPYRTKVQKQEARYVAHKGKDGAWHSLAPVSYHTQELQGRRDAYVTK